MIYEYCNRPYRLAVEVAKARDEMEIDAICLANTLLDDDKRGSRDYFIAEYRVSRAWHQLVHDLYCAPVTK